MPPVLAKHDPIGTVPMGDVLPAEDQLFAIVEASGAQYKVTPGDLLVLNNIRTKNPDGELVGNEMVLDDVLLVGGQQKTVIGRPYVPDARVVVDVEERRKGKKITAFKMKRRKGYARKTGYRPMQLICRVKRIEGGDELGVWEAPADAEPTDDADFESDDEESDDEESDDEESDEPLEEK